MKDALIGAAFATCLIASCCLPAITILLFFIAIK